jgi:hypothetical protein
MARLFLARRDLLLHIYVTCITDIERETIRARILEMSLEEVEATDKEILNKIHYRSLPNISKAA